MESNVPMDKNYEVHYFAVAYLDILGQQKEWEGFQGLSPDGNDEDLIKILERTVGFIHNFRNQFVKFFKGLDQARKDGKVSNLEDADLFTQAFSDTILISVSLREHPGFLIPIAGLYQCLASCSSSMIESMAKKHSIRGGIEVNFGVRLEKVQEIYGSALNAAYCLEKGAGYPRIVIGKGLLDYIEAAQNFSGDEKASQYRAFADRCMKFISKDDDDVDILDYMNPFFMEMLRKMAPDKLMTNLRGVGEHIKIEQEKWHREKDEKLIKRYGRLKNYFNSRIKNIDASLEI